jgi:O-antigen ligase
VELVFNTGLPGALLFLLFFLQWLREGFSTLRRIGDPRLHGALRWIIAFTMGSWLTGYLNGSCFMTYEFFLLMGVLAGAAPLRPALQREPPPIWPPAISRLVPDLVGRTLRGGLPG